MKQIYKPFRLNPYILIWGIVSLAGFSIMAFIATRQPMNSIDLSIAAWVQGYENEHLTGIMMLFSTLGSVRFSILIMSMAMAVLFFVLQHRMELLFLAASLGGAALMNKILKLGFQRERPLVHRLIEETGYSFPSGHAMGAFALYVALTFLLWRHVRSRSGRILLIVLSCMMIFMICVSRIYLGVHYPSDIIGALLASGLWLTVMIGIFQWYAWYTGRSTLLSRPKTPGSR
ncbi:phosphatase PAP2 family protein [Paenibacillus fonticola]|uniref:phosphatase PAP2 family protein n=1 Tax=Paenibacillus fonticola TaxID=379896 RepID=UPI00035C47A1|nr:phosphatase PAP2 family protein [Paenibacillus fonticola]